jgi:hypothetical protein
MKSISSKTKILYDAALVNMIKSRDNFILTANYSPNLSRVGALNNAIDESLRLALWVKIDEKKIIIRLDITN